jgi:ATP/maltotriose-dependent transcriptional regulator MalT
MAGTAYARGDLTRAAALAEQALARYRTLGYIRGVIRNLQLSANIARDRGGYTLALQRYQESLDMAREHDDQHQTIVLLESIAGIAATSGQPEAAVRLFAAATTLRERTGYRVGDPAEPNAREARESAARAAIGEQAFEEAWAAGHALSRERAIAEALAMVLPAT